MKLTNLEKHTTKNPIGRMFLDNFLTTVVMTIKPLDIESVLDVGCGEGFTLNRLQQEKIGKKLEGVDAVKESLAVGKKLHPQLSLKEGDIYNLRYSANSFDIVLCTEVLEHLQDPGKGLQELLRVSKRYALVTVPNEPWFTFQRIARLKNALHLGAHPEHIQHWTSGGFEKFVLNSRHSGLSRVSANKDSGVAGAPQNDDNQVKILVKKLPFPWTMLLLEKK